MSVDVFCRVGLSAILKYSLPDVFLPFLVLPQGATFSRRHYASCMREKGQAGFGKGQCAIEKGHIVSVRRWHLVPDVLPSLSSIDNGKDGRGDR